MHLSVEKLSGPNQALYGDEDIQQEFVVFVILAIFKWTYEKGHQKYKH